MELWEIILYSFTQGVTEFLPISSSSHLFILEHLLNWSVSGRSMAIAAHLGSLLAVCIYLKKDLLKIVCSFYSLKNFKKDNNILLVRNLFLITFPILVVGLLIFKNLDKELLSFNLIAIASIIGAGLLYIVDNNKIEKRNIYSLSILDSLFIGLFQIFALIPGASRAGTIITAARILKLTRIESTKLGLYSGLPTILGAVMLEALWLINNLSNNQEIISIIFILLLSFFFAYLSIIFLMKWLKNYTFLPFVIYRISLGIIILCFINI